MSGEGACGAQQNGAEQGENASDADAGSAEGPPFKGGIPGVGGSFA